MSYPKPMRFLSLLIVVSLLAGTLVPAALFAQTAAEESPPQGIRFDAPPYAIDGPYAVGVRYFTIPAESENDRELTASVWYPALNPDGETGEMIYEQQFQPGEIPPFSVLGHGLMDAEPDLSGGPYPLIVYSHAHWSMAQEVPYFTEHLASRGFVVISADHEDNWSTAFGPMAYEAVIRRPQEVTRQIDFAETLSADDGDLPGLIATEKVGVAGWSMGALTSMEVAGARKDLVTLREWCAADPRHVEALDFGCVDILENEAEMAEFTGLAEIPAGLWPSIKDERIVAAVPMSGPTATLGSEGLAYVDIPILFFHGGGEAEADPSVLMGNPYESVSSPRKAEVALAQGEHLLFFSSCADSPSIVEIGFPMFCTDPVWDTDRAHDLINHFTTAFFQAELKGDEEAAAALATNQVSFPGIEYREMGYGAAPEAMSASESKGLRPDAPVYGVRGPNAVGAQDFTIENGEDLITGTIWYPAKNSTNKLQEMTYTISEANGYFPGLPVLGRAIRDASPAIDEGPYPLVIFMTGGAAWRQMNSYLVEHLVSQGFVVIAADPRGEFPGDLWRGAPARILDTSTLIDYAETIHTADSGWTGMIDMEHVAVAGWSSGGWSALTAGGARFDFGWCAANPEFVAEHEDTDCNHFVPHLAEISEMVGLESVPDGMWPLLNDPRVDAVVALTPDGDIWGAEFEGVAAMDTPLLLMAGSSDSVNVPEVTTYPIYENAGSVNKGLVTLNGAGHMVFGNQCQATPWMVDEFFWGCSDSVWDMDRAHDLINHFVTAFLLAELTGDATAAAALAPEHVSFPGIEYQAEGYDATASLPAETVAEIESIVEEAMKGSVVPGMGVAVVQDGEIVYAQGFGVADVETGAPVTADTPFLWAESTFASTTFAVMQLVEQGKIDLDAPITDYLPYFQLADERYTDITVRHILQQRSGLADSGDRMADWTTFQPQVDPGALERHVRGLADKPLLFAPGTQQEWSDVAYTLLGDVIAKVSGQDFETYMQEHILSTLGMTHSSFLLDELDAGLMAQPHLKQAGKAVLSGHYPYHRPFGAANNLMASIGDMARLAQVSLNRGDLDGVSILSDDAFSQMWGESEPSPFGDFPFGVANPTKVMLEWGMGWFVSDDAGTPLYSTFGREYGFQGQMSVAPEAGLAVMAIGNAEITGAYYASDVAVDVLRMLLAASSE
ncbi:MAG: alpha/beta fold hydrolase [Caldilineaceae bacterium]|nr:alpha/beta fold hydrolase [Caldilineaceae bacterium]MBP8108745.1 alpha/beta fold hydrolase [Caldilineaceae bacterium]MBP8121542.1 alpha/beta fold hydrolase [Caldilineaceae bacterium]MBP9071423.1 alpha/beta fold hydrolase [Caldilineaceae bacterium]